MKDTRQIRTCQVCGTKYPSPVGRDTVTCGKADCIRKARDRGLFQKKAADAEATAPPVATKRRKKRH